MIVRVTCRGTVALTPKAEADRGISCRAATGKMSKSLFTKRISSFTMRPTRKGVPSADQRITSKPLIVAAAIFIVWKPRVGRITLFSAP